MTGETDLQTLIAQMRPMLDPEPYVFCTFANRTFQDLVDYDAIGLFAETEGTTAILPVERARELGLADAEWFRRITLTVHSSLEAVGLTAAIAAALTIDDRLTALEIVQAHEADLITLDSRRLGIEEGGGAPHRSQG